MAGQLKHRRDSQGRLRINLKHCKDLPRARTPELRINRQVALPLIERCIGMLAKHQEEHPGSIPSSVQDVVDLFESRAPKGPISRDFAELLAGIALEKTFSRGARLAALSYLMSDARQTMVYSSPAHAIISTLGASEESIKELQLLLTESEEHYKKRETAGIKIFTATLTMCIDLGVTLYSIVILDIMNKLNWASTLLVGLTAVAMTYPLLIGISKTCHWISRRNWEKAPEKNLEKIDGILTRVDEILPRISH